MSHVLRVVLLAGLLNTLGGCAFAPVGGNYYKQTLCKDGSLSAHCPLPVDDSWMWTPR